MDPRPPATVNRALDAALRRILRPLARLLMGRGLPLQYLTDLAKGVFVDVAAEEFQIADQPRPSISRIAVLTGLTRKEVTRIQKSRLGQSSTGDSTQARDYNRAARVTTAWIRESEFLSSDGVPRALPFDGEFGSFAALVRQHSGDMPARAVLDELVRVSAVRIIGDTQGEKPLQIELLDRGYIPKAGTDQKIEILGTDVAALISTIEHNLEPGPQGAYFQRKVSYDNIGEDALPDIRQLARTQGQKLLENLDRELSVYDRDINPTAHGPGHKTVMVGVYYWEEETPEVDEATSPTSKDDKQ